MTNPLFASAEPFPSPPDFSSLELVTEGDATSLSELRR